METHTIYTQYSIDLFHNPARIIIAGYSNSGKSEMCSNLIKKYHDKFDTILYYGVNSHDLQNNPDINEKLHISSEIVNPFDYSYNGNTLFILDDCFLEAIESKFVVNALTKGRHENFSTIFITQNIFFSGKFPRSIALNCRVTWVPNVQGDLPYQCYISHKITLSSFAPSEEEKSCDVTSTRHYLRGSYSSNLFEVRKTFFFLVLVVLSECLFISCHFREYGGITLGLA